MRRSTLAARCAALACLALLVAPSAGAASADLFGATVAAGELRVAADPDGARREEVFEALPAPFETPARAVVDAASEVPAAAGAPALQALALVPVVRIELAGGHVRLADHASMRDAVHVLPGSELVLPTPARTVATSVLPAPAPDAALAPALAPRSTDGETPTPRALAAPEDAPDPIAPAEGPSVAARASPRDGAPSWPERAVVAGAALALLVTPLLLYHRMRGAAVLGSGPRARMVTLLRAEPGLGPAEVARELGIDRSTAIYHLRRLVKERHLVVDESPRGPRYFAAGSTTPEERRQLVAARGAPTLLDAIRTSPGTSKSALAARLAIARATLHWHLGRLERAGLVRCERAGREVKVFPTQETFTSGAA